MTEFKKGDIVDYHSVIGGPVTSEKHEVNHVGELPSSGKVAWISGKSACVSIEALSHSDLTKVEKLQIRLVNCEESNANLLKNLQGSTDIASGQAIKILGLEKENEKLKAEKTKFHRLYDEECFKVAPLEGEVKLLKVALRKACNGLWNTGYGFKLPCDLGDNFYECPYDVEQCENCRVEYFLKEAEKELAK